MIMHDTDLHYILWNICTYTMLFPLFSLYLLGFLEVSLTVPKYIIVPFKSTRRKWLKLFDIKPQERSDSMCNSYRAVSFELSPKGQAVHDDVIKWKFFCVYWPFVWGFHRSPVNSTHKGQWRGTLIFPLICTWINGWVNNPEAGDLRCHCAHYDVTVMWDQPGTHGLSIHNPH